MYKSKTILVGTALKYKGNWDQIYDSIRKHERIEDEYLEEATKITSNVVTLLDSDYPEQLRGVFKPPFVLFYYGDLSLLSDCSNCISMVGSRDYSEYGGKMTRIIAEGLAKQGYTIVSGMARGIDTLAQVTAIDSGGKTIAVLGCGIDRCYPASNKDLYELIKKDHLVISEYPGTLEPQPHFFPIRNRIIAGLSKTLVITEAEPLSGTSTTAALAINGNTDVMCVPYPAGQQSECNRLIAAGAYLVESAEDVIEQMSKSHF